MPLRLLCLVLSLLLMTAPLPALVNPGLQPVDYRNRHRVVAGATVTAVDDATKEATLRIGIVVKGVLSLASVQITPGSDNSSDGGGVDLQKPAFAENAAVGSEAVLFLSQTRRGADDKGLLYLNDTWYPLQRNGKDEGHWQAGPHLGDQEGHGCFDGDTGRLLALMQDAANGRDYFPAFPLTRFQPPREIARLGGPCRGVALYDLDADGRLDALAASEAGLVALLQGADGSFADRTAALGLAGLRCRSLSCAHVDGDEHAELLVDGVIYARRNGVFAATTLLPPEANVQVMTSCFLDLDADGWPDVLISRVGGGLTAWRNPGGSGGPFTTMTTALGLDQPACGASGSGLVAPLWWNDAPRPGLFFAVGRGLLLLPGPDGRFAPLAHRLYGDFTVANDPGALGQAGGACLADLWEPGTSGLAIGSDNGLMLVHNRNGVPENVTGSGNESALPETSEMLAVLAEDLNLDGTVDLLGLSRNPSRRNGLWTNRGYGSFMVERVLPGNDGESFPGGGLDVGAWGAAAGDADGDGATDLLLGGLDGGLRMLSNACLTGRGEVDPAAPLYQQRLAGTKVLAVDLRGRGVLGAEVRILDAQGRTLTRRSIGGQVLTGCRGPDAVQIAIREPGALRLRLRWSDGTVQEQALTLAADGPVVQRLSLRR